ncbi:MAG: tRNA lysidine(34) synthetase TilS [Pirellulales bacterium]
MQPTHPFELKLQAAWPSAAWQDIGVLLAVSGGADSVALARAMCRLKTTGAGRLVVAHFNHRWRPAASDADQAFVQELARLLEQECVCGAADEPVEAASPDGREAAARAARYAFLQQAAEARGCRFVVTAHTADDQAETVLHHVLRGSGLAGLSGMPRTRPLGPAVTLIRPMLLLRRQEVLDYLAALDQPFRDDASNFDLHYTRNRIRHELLPQLVSGFGPVVVDSLVRLASLATDAQRVIESVATELLERAIVESDAAGVTIDCRKLAAADRHLVREALRAVWRRQEWPRQAMGLAEWDALADMLMGAREASSAAAQGSGNPQARSASEGETTCANDAPPSLALQVSVDSTRAPDHTRANTPAKRVFPGAITAQRQGERLMLRASSDTRF